MKLTRLWLAALAAAPLTALAQAGTPAPAAAPNVSMCTGCHLIPGYRMAYPDVYHVPKIVGQDAKYLEAALHAYRKGDRNNQSMMAVARGLDDAQITALAQWFAAQPAAPSK